MERRVTSHTEEEEMNQRRRLLTLARKGDQKSIDLLFELYQVKVFSGDELKKKKLPSFPVLKTSNGFGKGGSRGSQKKEKASKEPLSKSKKVTMEKPKPGSSGPSKIKTRTEGVKPSSKKSAKFTVKKKPGEKKATLTKKASPGKLSKPQKLGAAKKPRIAKKK
jgi:hypothetical protein